MNINKIILEKGITKYRLSKLSGIPHATLSDILSGKTRIEKCSGETLYKLSKVLDVSIDDLMLDYEYSLHYEYGLPLYLQKDLDEYKKGLKNNSSLIDCLWSELYASINAAEITDGLITSEHAQYLRDKFLWRR